MKEKYVFSFIANLSSNLIFLIVSYLIVLKFKVVLLGLWFFLNSVVSIGFLFTDIGFEKIHYQYSGNKNISDYFGTFFFIKIVLITLNIIITLFLVAILQLWNSPYFIYIFFLILSKVLFSLGNIFMINLRAKIKIFKSETPIVFNYYGKSLSNIYLILNFSNFTDPLLYLSISYFVFDIFFLLMILILSKNEFYIHKPKRDFALNYLKDAIPLIGFSIIYVIATNIGNLILDYSYGHESLSYFYLVNVYIIPYLLLITGSLTVVYLTLFSHYFGENDYDSIKGTTYKIEKYSSILFISVIIAIFLNGELMFDIFLPWYKKRTLPILYIMIFIPYIVGISRPYSYQMLAGKKQKSYAYLISLVYVLILVMIGIFILNNYSKSQSFELNSTEYAIALTIPWILYAIASRYYAYKFFSIKFQVKILLQIPIGILSLFLANYFKGLIFDYFIEHDILYLIFSTIIAIAIFLGLLFIVRQLKLEDIKFFLQLIKYKIYTKSAKEEFSKS